MAKEDLDSYYTDKFIKHRKVFDWIDQFTSQFREMNLIGDTDGDSISFKKELLAIIKKESLPDNDPSGKAWDTYQKHDELRPDGTGYADKAKQGYGIMACTYNCNDAVQDYWEGQDQTHANSWGFGGVRRDNKGNIIPSTNKYPVRVTDYADIKTGKVIDPKKAMYRGAMYYAILRSKSREKLDKELGGNAKSADVIKNAFERYNGSGSAARDYSNKTMGYYDQMLDLGKKSNKRDKFGEFWDKGNIKQKKGQDLATGLSNAPKAVWDDITSTYRNLSSPSDRQSGKGTLMRAIDRIGSGKFGFDQLTKSMTDPVKNAIGQAADAYHAIKPIGNKWVSDAQRKKENDAIIAQQLAYMKQKNTQIKKEKKESLEESTEQEILAKFAKEVLGLDISDEQMQQVIQRLDITDIVGIKRAIESGDFEGLSLGESKLKEYHSNKGMADKAKLARQGQAPNTQAAGQPLAPREPKKIAGNNANPEAPPTGVSNSTRKSVPSMPKSQIAKNLVVIDPDTGEELNVTNDLAATQMMRRAKRVG